MDVRVERIEEPYVRGSIFVPTEFMSEIYKLAQDKRGEHKSLEYVGKRVHIQFDFPLSEIKRLAARREEARAIPTICP